MAIPRRRFALAGGSLVLLAIVGVGLVQARSPQPPVVSSLATTATGPVTTGRPDAATRAALRLGARGRIVHGTVTIDSPKDGLVTVQVDGGTISSVDADSVTIAEKGGGSVTVATSAETRVRRDRKRATAGDLKVGDTVRVVSGVAADGSATAKLIVVTPPKAN